jgi:L-rhamnose-H+ transport protein
MWMLYSLFAYLIFPLLNVALTVSHLPNIYRSTDRETIVLTALLGVAWGIGVVFYGIALDIVGLSISSGIHLGMSVAFGSIIPLFLIGGLSIFSPYGMQILVAVTIMVSGVLLCARAGWLRERRSLVPEMLKQHKRFLRGILIAFFGGLLSSLLNVAFTVGLPIARKALDYGATPMNAPNCVWALCVSFGSLPSIAYCLLKLKKNQSWRFYTGPRTVRNTMLCLSMGVFFFVSTIAYGAAAETLGVLGPVIGWPIYMSALILGNNYWGWQTGEWKGAKGPPVWTMLSGIALQIIAMAFLGTANKT